jgi:hypothetical protein
MMREMAVQNRLELNIAAVAANLVKNDHQIISRITADSLNIPKTVVLWILKRISALEIFSCGTIMCPPTKLQVFANF